MKPIAVLLISCMLIANARAHDLGVGQLPQDIDFPFTQDASERPYVVRINIDITKAETVQVRAIDALEGTISGLYPALEDFSIQIIDDQGNVLYRDNLPVGFVRQVGTSEGDYVFERESVNVRARLPYFNRASALEIFHEDLRIKTILLSDYLCNRDGLCSQFETPARCPSECASTLPPPPTGCGNKICDTQETHLTCPADCESGRFDGYCDGKADGFCDPDCQAQEDADCGKLGSKPTLSIPTWMWLILFGVVVVFVIVLFMYLNKRTPPPRTSAAITRQLPPGTVQNPYYRIPPRVR